MRRPGIGIGCVCLLLALAGSASAASLPPSADPVAAFIAGADSMARAGDAPLSEFLTQNHVLVGAGVASLLDVAFQASAENPAGAKENVDLAKRIALAHEAAGGSKTARSLVETYTRWSSSQRTQRGKAIALEQQSAETRKAGDVEKAVSLLDQARAIYQKINDRHSVAVNWGTMGVTHWSTGNWDVVIKDYEEALAARRAVEDHILEGRTLNGLGSAYQQKGDWDRAAEYYRQAIDLRRRTGDLTGLGTSITYLGHVYNNTGRYVEARKQYEEALPILESLGNPKQMIELLTGIAAVNSAMRRLPDADQAYRQGIALAAQNGLGSHEMLCRRNLADNYRLQGRYSEALAELATVQELLKTNPDPLEEVNFYQTRGLTYLEMGELDDARDDLLHYAELAKGLDNPARAMDAHNNLGFLYRELGANDRALKAAETAKSLAETAQNGRGYRDALALRASIEKMTGRYPEAIASWQEALAQDQADGVESAVIMDEVSIAALRAVMGEREQARAQLRALSPRGRAMRLPDVDLLILFAMGQSFENENADSAAFYYEKSLQFIEAQQAGVGGSEIQTGFLSGQWRYDFEEVARFYAKTHSATGDERWSDRAFQTMERAKARGLLTLLQQRISREPAPEENRILDELYSLDPAANDYANRRAALEKQYVDQRQQRIQTTIAPLTAGQDIVNIEAVAGVLDGKNLVLEYALGDSASFLWVIGRNDSQLLSLPPRREIESGVRNFRDALARAGQADQEMLAGARALYRMLLEPVGDRLKKAKSVVIVPDGVLFDLPFDALLSADPVEARAMRDQPFLARQVATTYAPSATVYVSLKKSSGEKDFDRDLLAVGNPDFTRLTTNGTPLDPLPFAEAEVTAISAGIKPARKVVLTGAGASEARVKHELRTESPRVVHLATHGLIDTAEPTRSSVALAADAEEDGYFYTLEILGTPTQSRLVVMSACETAAGRVSRGEGVVGLSRAFLGAGAQSVVASLWAVSDESTAQLMKVFYAKMLGKKHTASRSLNEARIALIESDKFAHPFYWSPFVVTGTERSPW